MKTFKRLIYKLYKRQTKDIGFSLTESIVSFSILSIVSVTSLYFISIRQSTLHKSNITSAINDEIRRDIERLKYELWSLKYNEADINNPGNYEIYSVEDCKDIENSIMELPSWLPSEWIPGSTPGSGPGQIRNNVFKGRRITLSRELIVDSPFSIGSDDLVDKSLAKLIYKVRYNNKVINWSSIFLSSEFHSWCPPS